jgi:AcrR family transcriptional regulator
MVGAAQKPYHHGDLRVALLQAAEAALVDLPLDKLSLREIARRAGVSHAAPKHHFGSLGQLLGEVAARGYDLFVEELDAAANRVHDQTPRLRMAAMVRAYLRFAATNPKVYGLMFGQRDPHVAITPHLSTAMCAAWDQLEGQVTAMVGPQRARYGAVSVWASVHGLAMLRLDGKLPPNAETDAAIEYMTRMLMAGLEADL